MWLNLLWLNTVVKSSITETRQEWTGQLRGLSSASISFPEIILHNTKRLFSAEIWLFLTICPQLGGLRAALPWSAGAFSAGQREAAHPLWYLFHRSWALQAKRLSTKVHHSWWWLQELNMTAWDTLKLQDLNNILYITAVLFLIPVWIKKHRGHENY